MWYLYLDESGDLGFDFISKKPSKYFTVTILLVKGMQHNRALITAVKKTIRRKLNPEKKQKRIAQELKGNATSEGVKGYFFRQLEKVPFEIYCATLDKRQILHNLLADKHRLYNYISRLALEQIHFEEQIPTRIEMIIDRSKNVQQVKEFNAYVINQLQSKLDPRIPLDVHHRSSTHEYGLQAVDMISWGVFRKYERKDTEWYEKFFGKIEWQTFYP